MDGTRRILVATLAVGVAAPAAGQESAPLFADHSPLLVTIEADLRAVRDDRSDDPEERPARISWTLADGSVRSADLQIRTRGNFRLQKRNCQMPPIRLNFRTSEMEGTVFEGQDKLKLVTHCRDRDGYEQNVLEEYLVYRLYNQVTDRSFQVRVLKVSWVDGSGRDDPVTRAGFLIEDEDALAARLGGTMLEVPAAYPTDYVDEDAARVALFQYMVGNSDFSIVHFHNIKLLRLADGSAVPVPYDFDWTGLVNASYARPDESLNIRNVRQRVFRGFCRPDFDAAPLRARFRELRPAFEETAEGVPWLDEDNRKRVREYLGDFYEVLDDPGRTERNLTRACRATSD